MIKENKIIFYGEHGLNNFSYCIDSSINNTTIREELSKKIHSFHGKITFNITSDVVLIVNRLDLGMNLFERYKKFEKIYMFSKEGRVTFKRYNDEEKNVLMNFFDDDDSIESINNNKSFNRNYSQGNLLKILNFRKTNNNQKNISNNYMKNENTLRYNRNENLDDLKQRSVKSEKSEGLSENTFKESDINKINPTQFVNNSDLSNSVKNLNNEIKSLRIINLKDFEDVLTSLEKKNINYFYNHGLPIDYSPETTMCILMRGRNTRKRKLEYFSFKSSKKNKAEYPSVDLNVPNGYSIFNFKDEKRIIKSFMKKKENIAKGPREKNYDLSSPLPNTENKYCYICHKKLEEYYKHFDSEEHIDNCKKLSYIGESINKIFEKIEKNNENLYDIQNTEKEDLIKEVHESSNENEKVIKNIDNDKFEDEIIPIHQKNLSQSEFDKDNEKKELNSEIMQIKDDIVNNLQNSNKINNDDYKNNFKSHSDNFLNFYNSSITKRFLRSNKDELELHENMLYYKNNSYPRGLDQNINNNIFSRENFKTNNIRILKDIPEKNDEIKNLNITNQNLSYELYSERNDINNFCEVNKSKILESYFTKDKNFTFSNDAFNLNHSNENIKSLNFSESHLFLKENNTGMSNRRKLDLGKINIFDLDPKIMNSNFLSQIENSKKSYEEIQQKKSQIKSSSLSIEDKQKFDFALNKKSMDLISKNKTIFKNTYENKINQSLGLSLDFKDDDLNGYFKIMEQNEKNKEKDSFLKKKSTRSKNPYLSLKFEKNIVNLKNSIEKEKKEKVNEITQNLTKNHNKTTVIRENFLKKSSKNISVLHQRFSAEAHNRFRSNIFKK